MVAINRDLGYKDKKSFLKHASFHGAIRVPNDFPDNLIDFVDKKTGNRFIDPKNAVYCVGDLVEAILGLAWVMNERGQTLSPVAEDFVK